MTIMRRMPLLFLLYLLLVGWPAWAASVVIVTSERGGVYDEVTTAIIDELRPVLPIESIELVDGVQLDHAPLEQAKIVVTIGTDAATAVAAAAPPVPVLNTLLPRESHAQLARRSTLASVSAVFVDQPLERQIAAVSVALPQWQRLALIAGPHTGRLVDDLAAAAQAVGFEVMVARIGSDRELYGALQQVMAQPAILMAVPDREIFNSHTIQNILLTAYRQRSPVIGFSASYVRAGALLAVYSTPSQIGREAATAIRTVLNGGELPPPMHPREFEIGINPTVARSLGIRLEAAETIRSELLAREAKR